MQHLSSLFKQLLVFEMFLSVRNGSFSLISVTQHYPEIYPTTPIAYSFPSFVLLFVECHCMPSDRIKSQRRPGVWPHGALSLAGGQQTQGSARKALLDVHRAPWKQPHQSHWSSLQKTDQKCNKDRWEKIVFQATGNTDRLEGDTKAANTTWFLKQQLGLPTKIKDACQTGRLDQVLESLGC